MAADLALIPEQKPMGFRRAVVGLLWSEAIATRRVDIQHPVSQKRTVLEPIRSMQRQALQRGPRLRATLVAHRAGSAVADLLLQGGRLQRHRARHGRPGSGVRYAVPLATWYRYRPASERTQSSILLLTQHPCAKSSAELLLRLHPATRFVTKPRSLPALSRSGSCAATVHTDRKQHRLDTEAATAVYNTACWHSRTTWAGRDEQISELYACLYAKEFPAQALLRLRPELHSKAMCRDGGRSAHSSTCVR